MKDERISLVVKSINWGLVWLVLLRNKKQKHNVKTDIAFAISTFSLLIGGALSAIITFII